MILNLLLPGFGVGSLLAWLLLLFTPFNNDWLLVLLVGALAGIVWTAIQGRLREGRRRRLLRSSPDDWIHGQEVAVRGRLLCPGGGIDTPLFEGPVAIYGYQAEWRAGPRTTQGQSPSSQAFGFGMARCLLEVGQRGIRLHGLPEFGNVARESGAAAQDLHRLVAHWRAHAVRPWQRGSESLIEALRGLQAEGERGRTPDSEGRINPMDMLGSTGGAAEGLQTLLKQAPGEVPAESVVAQLQSLGGRLSVQVLKPGDEVIVVGRWNEAARRIECASGMLYWPGSEQPDGGPRLDTDRNALLLRLGAPRDPLRRRLRPGLTLAVLALLAVLLPLGSFLAPLATPYPQAAGPISALDLVMIALGDAQPIVDELLEPELPPDRARVLRQRLEAGELSTMAEWQRREIERVELWASGERALRLRLLAHILDRLRPDLAQPIGSSIGIGRHSRSLGVLPVQLTRGDSLALLLAHGLDPNQRDAHGRMALLAAADHCDAERLAMLLAAGASPDLLDPFQRNALDVAAAIRWPQPSRNPGTLDDMADCDAAIVVLTATGVAGGSRVLRWLVNADDLASLREAVTAGLDLAGGDPETGPVLEVAEFRLRSATDDERPVRAATVALLREAAAPSWAAGPGNGVALDGEHPALQALRAVYVAMQAGDEAAISLLYPTHARWRRGQDAVTLQAQALRSPQPDFEAEGWVRGDTATLRFRGKLGDGRAFTWYAQMGWRPEQGPRGEDPGHGAGWILRRTWGGEPRPF